MESKSQNALKTFLKKTTKCVHAIENKLFHIIHVWSQKVLKKITKIAVISTDLNMK